MVVSSSKLVIGIQCLVKMTKTVLVLKKIALSIRFLSEAGILAREARSNPNKAKLGKKAQERVDEAAAKAEDAAAELAAAEEAAKAAAEAPAEKAAAE
jgi:hypothetical protein